MNVKFFPLSGKKKFVIVTVTESIWNMSKLFTRSSEQLYKKFILKRVFRASSGILENIVLFQKKKR